MIYPEPPGVKSMLVSQLGKKCTIIEKHLCTSALPIDMTIGGDKRKNEKYKP